MSSPQHHIGLSLGMIDSLGDGLGEVSTQICERVAAAAPAWRDQHGVQFHLHMPERWHGMFGNHVNYLATHKLQGYWHWQGSQRYTGWHGLNQLGRIGPPLGTRHSLLTIHDLNALYHDSAPAARKSLRKLQSRLRKFEAVSTLTRYVEGDIRQHLGWKGPVAVIPNGARDLRSYPQQKIDSLQEGLFLLHLSRMAASKNPDCLIEMAALWPEQQLVLAGPYNSDSNRLLKVVQERQLTNVRIVQNVSDSQKAWLYANCLGFVFPSLTEGFGLPPLEAMHFGKPVFLSDRTSLPEVGGAWAAYFHSFNPQSMKEVIQSELPRLRAHATDIQQHAQKFTWDNAASAYMAIYRQWLRPA